MKRKRLLPDYASSFRDRHGRQRIRFRRTGYPTHYCQSPFGTEAFRAEYRAWLDGAPIEVGAGRALPGSIADLIARYYGSSSFKGGGPETQRKNRGIFEAFREAHGTKTVANVTFEHLDAIIATKAETHPSAARNLRKQLRRLFAFAVKCRMRPDNPVEQTENVRQRKGHKGFHTWTEEEIAQYRATHPLGTTARLALELYLWTGNRKTDALGLGRQHIKNSAFRITQQKTGKTLVIPIAPQLAEAIMATPATGQLALLVNAYGRPFTSAGFGARMRKWCDRAGLPHCTVHGLRKAISRRMAEAGSGNQGIKSITGHSSDSEVALYTAEANQEALGRTTMDRLVAWELANLGAEVANGVHKSLKGQV